MSLLHVAKWLARCFPRRSGVDHEGKLVVLLSHSSLRVRDVFDLGLTLVASWEVRLASGTGALPIAFGAQFITLAFTRALAVLVCNISGIGLASELPGRVLGRILVAVPALLLLLGVLFVTVLTLIVPVGALLCAAHQRVPRMVARLSVAAAMVTVAELMLYHMEWFDVWRWGLPPPRYWLTVVLPWGASYGVAGIIVGGAFVRWCRSVPFREFPWRSSGPSHTRLLRDR